jgi:hypothetical protein
MFYIGFKTGPRLDENGWLHAVGGLELGTESDSFLADLRVWSQRDYEAQWREAIARLAAGAASSALITSFGGPDADVHFMWPMWRVKDQVVFHERLLTDAIVKAPTSVQDFYSAVGERVMVDEDNETISEWIVSFADVLTFLTNA